MSDLDWLGGLLDADGSIGLEELTNSYNPYITFVANTNPVIIQEVKRILTENGIPFHISYNNPANRGRNAKETWQVRTKGKKRVGAALELLLTHLRGKRKQAELILEYCQGPKRRTTQSQRDLQVVAEVRSLNSRGLS